LWAQATTRRRGFSSWPCRSCKRDNSDFSRRRSKWRSSSVSTQLKCHSPCAAPSCAAQSFECVELVCKLRRHQRVDDAVLMRVHDIPGVVAHLGTSFPHATHAHRKVDPMFAPPPFFPIDEDSSSQRTPSPLQRTWYVSILGGWSHLHPAIKARTLACPSTGTAKTNRLCCYSSQWTPAFTLLVSLIIGACGHG
jgi:hypothetical protein